MPDNGDQQPTPPPTTSTTTEVTHTPPLAVPEDRSTIISQARAFVTSPQVIHQSAAAKRQFLAQKGLVDSEIDSILQQLPSSLPPPTYPRPPPSRLLTLLLGLFRVFSWVVGTTSILLLIYQRFLLPRVIRTAQARRSLKEHQIALLQKLNTNLTTLQEQQKEAFKVLPPPDLYAEPEPFASCASVLDITSILEKSRKAASDTPAQSLLRCAIRDLFASNEKKAPSAEQIFEYIHNALPWTPNEFEAYREPLWETLTTCSLFTEESSLWSYTKPMPPASVVVDSMAELSSALPTPPPKQTVIEKTQTPSQRTLQSLTAFTGYLSSQIYTPPRYLTPGLAANPSGGGLEEDIRKEIRALKGLALNRRSFLPPRPASAFSVLSGRGTPPA